MKAGFVSALAIACTLLGCSDEPDVVSNADGSQSVARPTPEKHELVNALVDSFDAPACLDAGIRYAGRKTGPDGLFHARDFIAPRVCVDQLKERVEALGFSRISEDMYEGALSSDSQDRIRIEIGEGQDFGAISWEVGLE